MSKTKHIALFWVIGLMLLTVSAIAIEVTRGRVAVVSPEKAEAVLDIKVRDYDQTAYDKGINAIDQEVMFKLQRELMGEAIKCRNGNDIARIEACTTALKNVNKGYEAPVGGIEEEVMP